MLIDSLEDGEVFKLRVVGTLLVKAKGILRVRTMTMLFCEFFIPKSRNYVGL
jgi:hypothetical protein